MPIIHCLTDLLTHCDLATTAGGLGVIGRAAHPNSNGGNVSAIDTNFIVWIEPERVSAGTYIATHFPDQVNHPTLDCMLVSAPLNASSWQLLCL